MSLYTRVLARFAALAVFLLCVAAINLTAQVSANQPGDRQFVRTASVSAQLADSETPPKSLLSISLWYFQKVVAMVVGGLSIYLGYRLFVLGVTGKASLSVKSAAVSGQLLNAAPGLFFAIGGMAIVAIAMWSK
jgi:hypothetical protein